MWKNQPCILTTKDFTILETMHERRHTLANTVRQILESKLDSATVVFSEDVDDKIVTLNTRVRYRISERPPQTAIITQGQMDGMVGQCLSLATVRGLALLGLAETAEMALPRQNDTSPDRMVIEAVLFQPEAARRQRIREEMARPSLCLVHDASTDSSSGFRRLPR